MSGSRIRSPWWQQSGRGYNCTPPSPQTTSATAPAQQLPDNGLTSGNKKPHMAQWGSKRGSVQRCRMMEPQQQKTAVHLPVTHPPPELDRMCHRITAHARSSDDNLVRALPRHPRCDERMNIKQPEKRALSRQRTERGIIT